MNLRFTAARIEVPIRPGPGPRAVRPSPAATQETVMNSIVYIVGLIVIVLAILSFLGLR